MKDFIFGEPLAGSQPSPEVEEDVFGENQEETQGEPQEPESAEGQEGDSLEEKEAPEKQGQPAPKKLYAGKFKSEEELEQGYINLMQFLGRELDTFTSVEDLEKAYLEAEKDVGKPKEQRTKEEKEKALQQELEQLRLAYQQQQMQMQQFAGYIQALLQAQQMGQSPQLQQANQPKEETVDPNALLEKWYQNPQQALDEMLQSVLPKRLQEILPQYAQELDRRVEQKISPIAEQFAVYQQVAEWTAAREEVAREFPDFEQYKDDIAAMFKDPMLLNIGQMHPEGKKYAIRMAYAQAKANRAQVDNLNLLNQQQQKISVLQKQAGKMGTSKVLKKPEPSAEEKILDEIFGGAGPTGIFG